MTTPQGAQTPSSRPNISALAEDLVRVDGLFDRRDERVALALCRLLGEGEPVSAERLAARTGRSASDVADWLRGASVQLDERGDVVAYHGTSLRPTINFFASEKTGNTFTNTKRFASAFLLTIEEGLELVRLTTSVVFGSALGDNDS